MEIGLPDIEDLWETLNALLDQRIRSLSLGLLGSFGFVPCSTSLSQAVAPGVHVPTTQGGAHVENRLVLIARAAIAGSFLRQRLPAE